MGISRHDALTLTFGTTTYFEVFDVREALAHEFKAAWLASGGALPEWSASPLRSAIGDPFDPFDPGRLLMSPGINTLTIRRGARGDHRFVLHERDGTAVADGRHRQPDARRRVSTLVGGGGHPQRFLLVAQHHP